MWTIWGLNKYYLMKAKQVPRPIFLFLTPNFDQLPRIVAQIIDFWVPQVSALDSSRRAGLLFGVRPRSAAW